MEHVKLDVPEPMLHLNFLGKDSIEYDNTNEINPRVYKYTRLSSNTLILAATLGSSLSL